jgi:hypothetical protein
VLVCSWSGVQLSNIDACFIKSAKDSSSVAGALAELLKACGLEFIDSVVWDSIDCPAEMDPVSSDSTITEDGTVTGSESSVVGPRITSNMEVCSMRSETSSKSKSGSGGAKDGRRTLAAGGLDDRLLPLSGLKALACGFGDDVDEIEFIRATTRAGDEEGSTDELEFTRVTIGAGDDDGKIVGGTLTAAILEEGVVDSDKAQGLRRSEDGGEMLVTVVVPAEADWSVETEREESVESTETCELSDEGGSETAFRAAEAVAPVDFWSSGGGGSSGVTGSPVDDTTSVVLLVRSRSLFSVEEDDCEMVRCLRAATIAAACSANVGFGAATEILSESAGRASSVAEEFSKHKKKQKMLSCAW